MSSMSSDIFESGRSEGERRAGRKPRADGVESRRAILHAAAHLATTRGLEGLSIGELAQHIGMSKSGLYAHFKSKEELELHVAFFTDRCGDALVRNPHPDDHLEADPAAEDEAAQYAVEALRDPTQSKSLVGFREEKRVLVYFLKSQKKAKASARR